MESKFKFYGPQGRVSESFDMDDILGGVGLPFATTVIKHISQYLGFKDANKTEVYQGDVLELKITSDLMDHDKSTFFNSNLGKLVEALGDVTAVICVMYRDDEIHQLSCRYDAYLVRNGHLVEREGYDAEDPEFEGYRWKTEASGYDFMFPAYLCSKGAVVVGNSCEEPDILNRWE